LHLSRGVGTSNRHAWIRAAVNVSIHRVGFGTRIMKKIIKAFLLIAAIQNCAAVAPAAVNPPPEVVPALQQWTGNAGVLSMPQRLVIRSNADDAKALKGVAGVLQEDLHAMGYADVEIRQKGSSTPGEIVLAIDPAVAAGNRLANQAYQFKVTDSVQISSATADGIFYGTRTLLQLLKTANGQLPCGTILDYPSYARRMLMIDVARKPFPVWVIKDFIRTMSWYKMNELHLHLSDDSFGSYSAFRIQSKKFPGLAAKDLSYSWEDLRDLQDFAEVRGITITPEIDMPGHAGSLTAYWPELRHPKGLIGKKQLDVTNPKTAEIMKSLLDEMIPLFDAPDFHIGTDEFRIGGTEEQRLEIGEDFRKFINTTNAFVRSKGKNCRIWSGFESMPGSTLPDPSVVVDMWVTHDAKSLIDAGHNVINSSDGTTYIVPGAHYYGVNNAGIYNNWEPYKIGGDAAKNPDKADPHLLGGKLHIWSDHGPSGYTLTEIADLALPSIQAFSEKLWGTKGSANYRDFQTLPALAIDVPGVTIHQRDPATGPDGLVYKRDGETTLADAGASVDLPWAKNPLADMEYSSQPASPSRADLEYPWTLSMKIKCTADLATRGVIMSSDLVEICANDTKETQTTEKDAAGKIIKKKTTTAGLGILRAASGFGADPHSSPHGNDTNGIISSPFPINQWVNVTIIGMPKKTECYIDGKLAGSSNNQMVCPLKHLGSTTGNSFIGVIKDVKVWNRVLSENEITKMLASQ
jgi:hexosaminidase